MRCLDLKEIILRTLKEKEDVLSVSVGADGTFRLMTSMGPVEFKVVLPESVNTAVLPN